MGENFKSSNKIHPVVSNILVDDLHITSILSNQNITINVDHEIDKDEALILALGYKQEFKREFSLWTLFAVSFSVLGLLPSIAACFDYQQLVVGMSPVPWILAIIFISSVALSMAEVASAFPTSSGTPYAVSQLAPPRWAPVLTWLTCCSNWLCQITAAPSVNNSCAWLILALKTYNSNDGYSPSYGEVYGLTTGIQIVHGIISSMPTRWLATFNSMGTITNILFLVIVFVMILGGNDRQDHFNDITKFNSNDTAWKFYNQTDWPMGIAVLQSFLGVIWAMSGYDSPFHLSEECSNANVAAPRAIILTATCGGGIGFLFMIAIAYTLVSIDQIAEDPQGLGQPFVTYLTQILSKKAVNAATALTIISSFFMGCSCMLAASRVTYAYARDGFFPLSRYWKIVNKKTQTPINAVWVNLFIGQLLLLLQFAGDTAIGAIFSVGGISGFVSFTMPTLLKITYANKSFKRGPWHLGRWSRPIGFVSVAFVTVMIPILCFPTVRGDDLTLDQMNWTVIVYFGPMLLSLLWFVIDAHKWYKGPRPNINDEDIVYGNSTIIDGYDNEKRNHNEVISSKDNDFI
ncbi:DEHA2A04422p [Debaryomyces hansenii CBS767]|uniref:DEHA2A04422p n=1 Tax=Debaryomyces hansenii (strain ATCC 36239 / CBS 767 / BCRC 21394 / JCM 1990 / NBRC 0083 / IGC 2968) TaxID=284592 RepID=Q6BZ55_DEBHA|nr:DEHA2A04422p [Debaryomyces hansenii CBS767]CAG84469.2 DEHA2A04422p [Debaryomyces hansenii CBS767]|eukprot:XP_456514.2 DEHA2A04422p [Debaryomyces hansenii CBS767]